MSKHSNTNEKNVINNEKLIVYQIFSSWKVSSFCKVNGKLQVVQLVNVMTQNYSIIINLNKCKNQKEKC